MKRSVFETILGALVLVIAATFLVMAYKKSDSTHSSATYELIANFSSVAGLHNGADIRIAGVKVGDVGALDLDPKTYQATAHLTLDSTVQVPDDSVVEIASEGLLGGSYIAIDIGASDKNLKPGAAFQYTQAGINLQQLIGQMIFSKGSNGGGDANAAPAASAAPMPMGGAAAAPMGTQAAAPAAPAAAAPAHP